jgi:hypothetical protein
MPNELSELQVKELNKERIARTHRKQAEAMQARKDSDAQRAWWLFSKNHAGVVGNQNGSYFSSEANDNILNGYLQDNELDVTLENLEAAFAACSQMLCERPGEYQRVTDTQTSRVMPQVKNLSVGPEPIRLPYTREEILGWETSRLKAEIHKGPAHLAEVNRILAGN